MEGTAVAGISDRCGKYEKRNEGAGVLVGTQAKLRSGRLKGSVLFTLIRGALTHRANPD